MVYLFLTDDFEEIEAITTVDILRRAQIPVRTVGLVKTEVRSAHGITVCADTLFENTDFSDADALILPGGSGSLDFAKHAGLCTLLRVKAEQGCLVAAICAAPSVLGDLGLLRGYRATCYPGFEQHLLDAHKVSDAVCADRNRITACGPGASSVFAFALIRHLSPAFDIAALKDAMQYA